MTVELTAPDSAEEGTYVSVSVKVTNILGHHASFRPEVFVGADRIFSTSEIIYDGQSKTFNTGFTMPASDVTVLAWVDRWRFDYWDYYGAVSKLVSLEVPVPVPELAGRITRKELDYDAVRVPFPAQ